jgi:hypothetical protein
VVTAPEHGTELTLRLPLSPRSALVLGPGNPGNGGPVPQSNALRAEPV